MKKIGVRKENSSLVLFLTVHHAVVTIDVIMKKVGVRKENSSSVLFSTVTHAVITTDAMWIMTITRLPSNVNKFKRSVNGCTYINIFAIPL